MSTIFKFSLSFCSMAALTVYLFLRILFYEIHNPVWEECWLLIRLALVTLTISGIITFVILGADMAGKLYHRKASLRFAVSPLKLAMLLLVFSTMFIYACNGQTISKGVKKDFTTGLTATYNNIEPEEVLLVMNEEVLHHNDIPIGESFLLINKNVKGFIEKNGKVSVGCSLTISDKHGKKILDAKDLFAGKDIFNKSDVKYLKCTVNTGKPMEWEEKYEVVATFWDKYGKGKIINKVTIRAIDIP